MGTLAGLRLGLLALGLLLLAAAPGVQTREPAAPAQAAVQAQDAQTTGRTSNPPAQWLDRVAEFFRQPIVYVVLIALGLIGLIFEIKYPGTTLPGSVAAICFVLFFWAYSFVGEFTLLAILLFLLGLVFLGIEVFVVPGLGFSGVAGAVLMFVGLLLVTLKHWPTGQQEWTDVGSTFGTLSIGMALAVAGALTLTWSLPNLPVLNRMVLKPPGEEVPPALPASLTNSGRFALLGAIGVAVTPLRPSGKAQFGEQFLDVLAEGDYLAPGSRVQVIEIEGPRIIVKEV